MQMCDDMYNLSIGELVQLFGSYGSSLYNLIRGIDHREVEENRVRKSISVEDTFINDLREIRSCTDKITILYSKLIRRCNDSNISASATKEIFLKIKFSDFETITRQKKCDTLSVNNFIDLFTNNIIKVEKPIRLLGIGFKLKKRKKMTRTSMIFSIDNLRYIL